MYRTEVLKKIVDDVGGAIILAHPYRRRLYGDMDVHAAVEQHYQKPIFKMVDAIEVSNGKASPPQNRFSQEIQRRLKLKGVGGSDAHVAADIPSSATFFERKIRNLEDLITEIKVGRFHAVDLRAAPGLLKK
jgi:predicted metal-dependent phosphoesterase TrpH